MVLPRQPTRGAQLLGIAVGFVGVVFVSLPSIGVAFVIGGAFLASRKTATASKRQLTSTR